MLYHISKVSNLKVLEAKMSTHGEKWVYAIDNVVAGLLFGAKHDDFDFMLDINGDKKVEIYECYEDAFKNIYKGTSCSVYEVQEDGFLKGMTTWSPEYICGHNVNIVNETIVDDLLQRLCKEEELGNLVIHRFENNKSYKAKICERVVDRIIRFNLINKLDQDIRFQKYYKKIIDSLRVLMDGTLLDSEGEKS